MGADRRSAERRRWLAGALGLAAGTTAWPLDAAARRLAAMTDGPFYPPARWRQAWADQDSDLTQVRRAGQVLVAQGEHLELQLQISDENGRRIDSVQVEIWQCDALGQYRQPSVSASQPHDPGFQGFGAGRSDDQGRVRFRTIRPVNYPGRTPHIHLKLRHASFGEVTSQLFVDGEPGNERDGLWRWLPAADRGALAMKLQPVPAGSDLRWRVSHAIELAA